MQEDKTSWLKFLETITNGNESFLELEEIENEIQKTQVKLSELTIRRETILSQLKNNLISIKQQGVKLWN